MTHVALDRTETLLLAPCMLQAPLVVTHALVMLIQLREPEESNRTTLRIPVLNAPMPPISKLLDREVLLALTEMEPAQKRRPPSRTDKLLFVPPLPLVPIIIDPLLARSGTAYHAEPAPTTTPVLYDEFAPMVPPLLNIFAPLETINRLAMALAPPIRVYCVLVHMEPVSESSAKLLEAPAPSPTLFRLVAKSLPPLLMIKLLPIPRVPTVTVPLSTVFVQTALGPLMISVPDAFVLAPTRVWSADTTPLVTMNGPAEK